MRMRANSAHDESVHERAQMVTHVHGIKLMLTGGVWVWGPVCGLAVSRSAVSGVSRLEHSTAMLASR